MTGRYLGLPEDLVVFVSRRFSDVEGQGYPMLAPLLRELGATVIEGDTAGGAQLPDDVASRIAVADVVVALWEGPARQASGRQTPVDAGATSTPNASPSGSVSEGGSTSARPTPSGGARSAWVVQEAYHAATTGKPVIFLVPIEADEESAWGVGGLLGAPRYVKIPSDFAATCLSAERALRALREESENPTDLVDATRSPETKSWDLNALKDLERVQVEPVTTPIPALRDLVRSLQTAATLRSAATSAPLTERTDSQDDALLAPAMLLGWGALGLGLLLPVLYLGALTWGRPWVVPLDAVDVVGIAARMGHVVFLGFASCGLMHQWIHLRTGRTAGPNAYVDEWLGDDHGFSNRVLHANHPLRRRLSTVWGAFFAAVLCLFLAYATSLATITWNELMPLSVEAPAVSVSATGCDGAARSTVDCAPASPGVAPVVGSDGLLDGLRRAFGLAPPVDRLPGAFVRVPLHAPTGCVGVSKAEANCAFRWDARCLPGVVVIFFFVAAGAFAMHVAFLLRNPMTAGFGWSRPVVYLVVGLTTVVIRVFVDRVTPCGSMAECDVGLYYFAWLAPDAFTFVGWSLVAARLATRELDTGAAAFISVFLYAALQPMSVLVQSLPNADQLNAMTYVLALGLKVALVWAMVSALLSGRLQWALLFAAWRDQQADRQRQLWLDGLRTLSIENVRREEERMVPTPPARR